MIDSITPYQSSACKEGPGNRSGPNEHAMLSGEPGAPAAPESPADTFGSQALYEKENRDQGSSGLRKFIRGLNPFRAPSAHQAAPYPPVLDPAPLDTTNLWQEVSALTQSMKGASATASLPAALSAESREKLALLLSRLNDHGVRFGSGARKSLTAGTIEPEDLAARLSVPGETAPCWVEGPDFRQRPLRGLHDIQVLDALYGTHNRHGLPLATLAMTLDHLAGLGYNLSLVYSGARLETPAGKFGIYQRYEEDRNLDHRSDCEVKYSTLEITDDQGRSSQVYYERDVRAHAFFEFAAPEAVMGDEIKAARGLRALTSRGMQLYENIYPGHMKEKKLVAVTLEKAWSEMHTGEGGSRPIYVTSPHCDKPRELTLGSLKECHPMVLDALQSLCPTARMAEEIWVESEGLMPGYDQADSIEHMEDLRRRMSARGNPAMGWLANPSLGTAGWAYQVIRTGLLENPQWSGAIDQVKQYVVELGPYAANESFKRLPAKLGDIAGDPSALKAFFTLAAAGGSPWQGLTLYEELKGTPEKLKIVLDLLPGLEPQKGEGKTRTARALSMAECIGSSCLPGESSLDAFSRWERISALLPGADKESLLELYSEVTGELRDGRWDSLDQVLQTLGTHLLFTRDPAELRERLKALVDDSAGSSVPPFIEQWDNDLFIDGVRLRVQSP